MSHQVTRPSGIPSPPDGAAGTRHGGARVPAAALAPDVRGRHLALFGGLLALLSIASLFVGVSDVSPIDLLTGDPRQRQVFLASRVPRLAAVLLSGAAMSVAGLVMQHLARNRFVAPSTAGTIESAGLGILVATVWFGSSSLLAKMVVAVVFAMLGTAVFLAIVRRVTFRDVLLVPLIGLMFGGVVEGVTTFFAYRMSLLQTVEAWTIGDFSGVLRGRYELLWLAAAVTLAVYVYADRITIAGMGRDMATSLGLRHERTMTLGLAIVAMVTGVVVVVVGTIPFLGLVVPNVVARLLGDNIRRVLPVTAMAGAGLVLVCDVVGRIVRYPYEIPVGTVLGVIGSLVFLVLLLRGDGADATNGATRVG